MIFGVMKKVEAPPVTHKTGQKAPPLHFPSSYKDWAQFQLSDQVTLNVQNVIRVQIGIATSMCLRYVY